MEVNTPTVKGKVESKQKLRDRAGNWPTPTRPVSYFRRWLYASYRSGAGVAYNWNLRITPKGWFILGCLCLAAFLGLDTNRTTAYQIFAFLFALVGVGAALTPFFQGKFAIKRELPHFGSVGVPLRYHVRVQNLNGERYDELFLWENILDARPGLEEFAFTPEPGESYRNWFDRKFIFYRWKWLMDRKRVAEVERSGAFSLGPREEAIVPMQIVPARRGVLHLESARVIRLDPFALFRGDAWPKCDSASLLVLPRRYALPMIDLGGERHYQQGGASIAGAYGNSDEFVALREYRPGDPLRHIHWRSWARLGQPIVKEFEEQYFPRHALVVDTFALPEQAHLFEETVSVAASFAYSLNTNDCLLDLLFLGTEAFSFTAGRGAASIEKMLEILAAIESQQPSEFTQLEIMLQQQVREVSAIIVVLTGWDEGREAFLNNLRKLGRPILPIAVVETRPGASALQHMMSPEERRMEDRRKLIGKTVAKGEPVPETEDPDAHAWDAEQQRTGVNFVAYTRIQQGLARLRTA